MSALCLAIKICIRYVSEEGAQCNILLLQYILLILVFDVSIEPY